MRSTIWKPLALAALAAACAGADAAEDTDTPGAGKWEINLNLAAERNSSGWEYVVPEAEFNYGWGERAQLVFGVPRMMLVEPGAGSRSGLGSATAGIKWRLLDQEDAGFALALFPAYSWNLSESAARRGLADPGRRLVLPLVVGVRTGGTALFAEAGRVLVQHGPNEWLAGLKLTRQCHAKVECRVDIEHEIIPRQVGHTFAGMGIKWSVDEALILQASVGRDIGPSREEKHQFALKFGVQLLR